MQKIRIFLASSNELKADREQFELKVSRTHEQWEDEGIGLQLDIWEKLSKKMSLTRSQDEYNKVIGEVDVFVSLAQHWVGDYTEEEFDAARKLFQSTGKPEIFTFFKPPEDLSKVKPSLQAFKDKLAGLEHFYPFYDNFDHLWNQLYPELERLKKVKRSSDPGNDKATFQNFGKVGQVNQNSQVNNSGANFNL